jgi:mono/diheme cytochrome c family protein
MTLDQTARWTAITPRSACCALAMVMASLAMTRSAMAAENVAGLTQMPSLSAGVRFSETTGGELFAGVCQGCHMPDGRGAVGAGSYPALANDRNLEAKGYPVTVVLRGLRGMPPVGGYMSDDQVAAVVNYVRTHFGNGYDDAVTVEDVKAVRP